MTNQVSSPKNGSPLMIPCLTLLPLVLERKLETSKSQLGFKLSDEAIDGIFLAEAMGTPATNNNFRRFCSKFWDGKKKMFQVFFCCKKWCKTVWGKAKKLYITTFGNHANQLKPLPVATSAWTHLLGGWVTPKRPMGWSYSPHLRRENLPSQKFNGWNLKMMVSK